MHGLFRMMMATLLAVMPAALAAAPQRIVSLHMCADQYLIALADPGQIAALTSYARDPAMSYYAERAKAFRTTQRSAEEIVALKPDLVVGVPWRQRHSLDLLAKSGVPMIDVPRADSLADTEEAITAVAQAVGHPERGRALIASIRVRLAGFGTPPGRGRVAAYYQRRGYLTGTGTLMDEIMQRVGLVNLAGRLDKSKLSRLSVEEMAMTRPDFLIMDSATARVADKGTEMMHHPVLDLAVPAMHRLYIPQALTLCGGPAYPEAVEVMAAQIRAADRVRRSGGRTSR